MQPFARPAVRLPIVVVPLTDPAADAPRPAADLAVDLAELGIQAGPDRAELARLQQDVVEAQLRLGVSQGAQLDEANQRLVASLLKTRDESESTERAVQEASGYLQQLDTMFESSRDALVAIDANSLEKRPLWPWPRSWHATLVDRLVDAGAAQNVLDIDFSAASTEAEDTALAAALHRAGERVILPVFQQPAQQQSNAMVENFPMAALAERARIASANIHADGDGIVRRMPQLLEWGGALVPTLAAAAAGSRTTDEFLIDYGIRAEAFPTVS